MAVAKAYQQPRSVILGRVVKPGEPLWLPMDLEWAIAYEEHLSKICGGCGTPRDAWVGAKPGDLPYVGVARICAGCREKGETEQEIPEDQRKPWQYVEMVPAAVHDWREEARDAADRLELPDPFRHERVG